MGFSRAKQRQYITLHSLTTLEPFVRECLPQVPRKSADCLRRIERRRSGMLSAYAITEKERRAVIRKYLRATARYADDEADINPVEYVSACLLMVDDVSREVSGRVPARERREWDLLTQSLFTLARHLDPDLDHPGQANGQRLGEIVMREFGG